MQALRTWRGSGAPSFSLKSGFPAPMSTSKSSKPGQRLWAAISVWKKSGASNLVGLLRLWLEDRAFSIPKVKMLPGQIFWVLRLGEKLIYYIDLYILYFSGIIGWPQH